MDQAASYLTHPQLELPDDGRRASSGRSAEAHPRRLRLAAEDRVRELLDLERSSGRRTSPPKGTSTSGSTPVRPRRRWPPSAPRRPTRRSPPSPGSAPSRWATTGSRSTASWLPPPLPRADRRSRPRTVVEAALRLRVRDRPGSAPVRRRGVAAIADRGVRSTCGSCTDPSTGPASSRPSIISPTWAARSRPPTCGRCWPSSPTRPRPTPSWSPTFLPGRWVPSWTTCSPGATSWSAATSPGCATTSPAGASRSVASSSCVGNLGRS